MKLLKILHYVESSFEDEPSFVLLMSDNKEYISNGCVFIENNEDNIEHLTDKYDCKRYLDELFASDSKEMNEITNANYMFYNSNITEFDSDMSSVTNAEYMFYDTNMTKFNSDMSNVTNVDCMFFNTPYGRSVNND